MVVREATHTGRDEEAETNILQARERWRTREVGKGSISPSFLG